MGTFFYRRAAKIRVMRLLDRGAMTLGQKPT